MSVHISVYIMYTVCNRKYTGRYVEGVYTEFYTCGRIPYMSAHISVYIMYTVCNRRYTGRYMEGVYTEFYTCGRIPYMSVHISVYIMYTVFITYRAKLLNADWLRQRAFFLNHDLEGTFGNQERA